MRAIVIIIVIVLLPFSGCFVYRATSGDEMIKINSKERVVKDDDSYYLVYTEKEVFTIQDSWSFFTFNSSDRYGKLLPGQTYRVQVAGWRIPFFSKYRNIVHVYTH